MRFDSVPVQVMENSMDAQWIKMRVAGDNIANYETPGYKAKMVSFSKVYEEEKCKSELHGKQHGEQGQYRTMIATDETTESRVDGNNVSLEKEQTELWRAYAQYNYLVQKVNGHYTTLKNVIGQMSR